MIVLCALLHTGDASPFPISQTRSFTFLIITSQTQPLQHQASALSIGGEAWDYRDIRSQQLLSRLIEKMRALPQPLVAAVDGIAAGAGLALALACDLRVATSASSFSAAFVRLGLTGSDMATSFFAPRVAALGVAAELLLTGRALGAERAFQLGMLNALAAGPAELRVEAEGLAKDMLLCSYKVLLGVARASGGCSMQQGHVHRTGAGEED